MSDTERAQLAATELLADHNFSMRVATYEVIHSYVAAAYAQGNRDGYQEAVDAFKTLHNPSFTLTEAPHGR